MTKNGYNIYVRENKRNKREEIEMQKVINSFSSLGEELGIGMKNKIQIGLRST